MKIVCVNNISGNIEPPTITINKSYDVITIHGGFYYITNDSNDNGLYLKKYFISLEEYRDNIINTLI